MKKAKVVASIAAIVATIGTAHAATFQSVGANCGDNGALSFTDASGVTQVACIGGKWVDVKKVDQVAVRFESFSSQASAAATAASRWFFNRTGFVGVPFQMDISNESRYAASTTASAVKVVTLETGVSAEATVLSLNPDHTAHVVGDIDVQKVGKRWQKHIDANIPVGEKTVVVKDDDGVEYSLTVDNLHG